jgi:hypothetical protein
MDRQSAVGSLFRGEQACKSQGLQSPQLNRHSENLSNSSALTLPVKCVICALAKRTPPVSGVEIHCVRILTISNSNRRMSSNPFLRCGPIGDGRVIISMGNIETSIALELPRFNKRSADRLTCPSCIPSPWTLLRSYKGVAGECTKCAIHDWVELFD